MSFEYVFILINTHLSLEVHIRFHFARYSTCIILYQFYDLKKNISDYINECFSILFKIRFLHDLKTKDVKA